MLKIKSRKQQHLFDPWQFLSPKRREILDQSWPGFFRDHVLRSALRSTFAQTVRLPIAVRSKEAPSFST
ncbi:MAG: hypothetical protein PHV70_12860 [Desulfobacteraceae bacterium]|nr:hypothetical protein [Desulfobacteraceae bacterium]